MSGVPGLALRSIGRGLSESVGGLPRAFWWLWTSTLVNRLGSFVATFLALYLTVERGYSASYAGLVGALYGAGGVVASIGAGVLTDRLGRRPTLLLAQLSTAASVAALSLVTHPVAIAAVAGVVGMSTAGSRPAVQAMIADLVRPEDRVRAFALNYWAINLGFAISSTAAGLIAKYSYHLLFFSEAAMVLACAVLVFVKLPESRPERAGQRRGPGGADGAGGAAEEDRRVSLWTVLRDGRFMTVVGLSLLVASLIQQGFVALPIAMGEQGFSSSDFGLAIAANGLLIVLIQLPVTRLIQGRDPGRILVVSTVLIGLGFGLNAFAGSVPFYVFAVVVWTVGEVVNTPTQMGLVVRLSPVHGRGRYQGMYSMSWAAANLTAPLVGGFVIQHFGSTALWTGSAAVGLVTALGYAVLLRRVDDGRAPDGERPADGPRAPRDGAGAAHGPAAEARAGERERVTEPAAPRTDSTA
ncbi:MFS transporter [Streptomyces sp. SB3404]|uniref:MFS transporter n=2 Tax=Streptomyces boncukensis TaxID=2711219 RepID=A0A6G4X4D4_9ACTN|nr:MFS transporter [Streptomyces boncukensis]NGO71740.1 MFS transporter [Streptomyces boncukensis]